MITARRVAAAVPLPGFRPYRFRDPARNTLARLAELAALDGRAAREQGLSPVNERAQAAAMARRAEFAALRARDVSVADAARRLSVSESTARRYEQERRAGGGT
jgi:DNA-binding transcriptional regulator YiaG